jgi:hypothetical protein
MTLISHVSYYPRPTLSSMIVICRVKKFSCSQGLRQLLCFYVATPLPWEASITIFQVFSTACESSG